MDGGGVILVGGCTQVAEAPRVAEGRSSYRFVEQDAAVTGRPDVRTPNQVNEPVDVLVTPRAIEPLVAPVYPAEAVGRQTVPVTIGVRLTVSVEGAVTEVAPSLRVLAWAGPAAEAFRAAVEMAVRQWRFEPAEWRRMVPRPGGPDGGYWQVTKVEKREGQVDVEFTFTASGEVLPVKR